MNIIDRLRVAARSFRAAPSLYRSYTSGESDRPELTLTQLTMYEKCAAVYACVKIRADNLARPRLRVYAKKTNEPVEEHALQMLLDKPNPFWTRGQLMRALETDLCLRGNAYLAIDRGEDGNRELWRMRPDCVKVIPHEINYIDHYEYDVSNFVTKWSPRDVLHFRYTNPYNELYGLTPLGACRLSAEMGMDAIEMNRVLFTNYAVPDAALKTKQPLNPTQAEEITTKWNEALRGVKKQHKTVILPFGLEVERLTMNPKDLEWLNAMKWSLDDVSRVFRVPAPLIGEEKAVYRNISEAELMLWRESLIPELLWFEEIINNELAVLFDNEHYVRADLSVVEALQEDANQRIDRAYKMWTMGVPLNMLIDNGHLYPFDTSKLPWGNAAWLPLDLAPAASSIERQAPAQSMLESKPSVKGDTSSALLDLESRAMQQEREDVRKILANFFESERQVIADAYTSDASARSLIASSLETYQATYDWGRWLKLLAKPLAESLIPIMRRGTKDASRQVGITPSFAIEHVNASEWAKKNAADLLSLTGKRSIVEETRKRVKEIVVKAVRDGTSVNSIRELIRDDSVFNRARATMIARTETQRAYNTGNIQTYRVAGIKKKSWFVVGAAPCDDCIEHEARGIVDIDAQFGEHDAPPAHPHCFCRVMPEKEKED